MNSMIPLMGRGMQINDPLDTAVKGATLQDLMQQSQMRQAQMDELKRKAGLEAAERARVKEIFDTTTEWYNARKLSERTQAAQEAAATDTANPAQYPPGSAQSPIANGPVNTQPGLTPAEAAPGAYMIGKPPPKPVVSTEDINAPKVGIESVDYATMLKDPTFHRLFGGVLYQEGLRKYGDDALAHASKLEELKSPLGKTLSDLEQMGGKAGSDVRDRAISSALKTPSFTMIVDGKTVPDQVAIDAYRKAHPDHPLVSVDIGDKANLAGMKEMRQRDAIRVDKLREDAQSAVKLLSPLSRMEQLTKDGKTYSGNYADWQLKIGQIAAGLGVPIDWTKVAASEQYGSEVASAVVQKIKALGSGTGISDADRLFTENSLPNLMKTPEGRLKVIKALKSDAMRIYSDHKSARAWFDSHESSLSGWEPPSMKEFENSVSKGWGIEDLPDAQQ